MTLFKPNEPKKSEMLINLQEPTKKTFFDTLKGMLLHLTTHLVIGRIERFDCYLMSVENDFTGFRVGTSDDHETVKSRTDAD